jgi:hypothetical protein
MTNYRDLPPSRDRRLAYSRELQNLQENLQENLYLGSSNFQNLMIQPISSLTRRPALRRRAAFHVSRPNIVNGIPINQINYSGQVDYSDMPPLEEVPDVPNNSYTYEYLSELPNVIVNLVNEKLIEKSSVSMNYFNDNFCVICQENIQISPKQKCIMRVLECTHAFHIDCVDKWFTTNKTCPTCKYTLD